VKTHKYDLIVRWCDKGDVRRLVQRHKGLALHGEPQSLRCPGGTVAVLQKGHVAVVFTVAGIRGPLPVQLANGKRMHTGFLLLAKARTIRQPHASEERSFSGLRWRAIGQFRYCNFALGRPEFVSEPPQGSTKDYIGEGGQGSRNEERYFSRPYRKGAYPSPRSNPEAQLVDAYVAWVNRPESFEHQWLRGSNMWADLLDRRYWRLIEAKASIERENLRTALGQLYDYKRNIPRRPSLGILLPRKPAQAAVAFLEAYNIAVIWRTPTGRFADSRGGAWTERSG
jgi:hypothetical protein